MKMLNLSAHFPILDVQGHLVYAANGNLVLGYRVLLPEVYTLGDADFEAMHRLWFRAFKELPSGVIVHKQDLYRKAKYTSEELPQATFLQKATHRYFKGRDYLQHQSFLFFSWPADPNLKLANYVNPFIRVKKEIPEEMDHKAKTFRAAVADAVAYLGSSGKVSLLPLEEKEFLAMTRAYFNGYNEGVDTDFQLERQGIAAGAHYFDVLALNNEACFGMGVQTSRIDPHYSGEDFQFHQGFIDGLGLGLNCDHIVNHILYMDDKHRWRRILEKKIEALSKSVHFGTQNKVILTKIKALVKTINEDEEARIIRGHLNVIFWADQKETLRHIASQIKTECRELDIIPYAPQGETRKAYFVNAYPCFTSHFLEEDLYVTDLKHALCLWISTTNYRSDPTGILFNDRAWNLPVFKDVWDQKKKRIKARNFAIFAPTGEGKSFLANHILRQYFEAGVQLVIIDLGGSYAKFAKLYPEDHLLLRYREGESLGINPFYKKTSGALPSDRLEDLCVFLWELLGPSITVSKAQEVALKKILVHYYAEVLKGHSLSSLYRFVEQHQKDLYTRLAIAEKHFDLHNFLHVLSQYVEGGLYGFLFASGADQAHILEEKQLIIFELDEVRQHKELLSIMLKLIKTAIQRTIWQDRSKRGIILFDEFAKQLKFANVLESVEYYYQAIRKQNGAIGIILQSISQLPDTPASASILENTQVLYSLRNEKGYDPLQKRLNLSGHDVRQLRSLRNRLFGVRKYTEVFLKIGKESNVYRLEVPPEVYAAYLTDGTESEALMEGYRRYGDMEKAITEFLTRKANAQ